MTTIKEIALKTGYSTATVSRILNNDLTFSVTDATRQAVQIAARQLNYVSTTTNQLLYLELAVIFSINPEEELEDVYYIKMRQLIESTALKNGLKINFYRNLLDLPQTVKGVLLIGKFNENALDELIEREIICVFIDSNPNPGVFTSVQPNLEFAITRALNEFKSRNFKKVGFIGGNLWNKGNNAFQFEDLRRRYFESYAKEISVYSKDTVFIGPDFSTVSGYQIGQEILQKYTTDEIPRAFLIGSDSLAIGVLRAFNEKNIAVPGTTAFISINDIEIAKFSSPALTTFKINISDMIDEALNLLHQKIINPKRISPEVVLKSPELIYRETFPKELGNV
ncbi:hypothetical protein LH61_04560 [Leuconostoc mesenteroides P45]|uniref:LacI family DNA-binding transcriptional regulator n=1 Tax=Leuconostoc mesenteroides TaxID=1245 RepID=UPI0005012561|nr:LacI family DNA-binding transcriptional regulator [Leuconostoc mesenteroides]KGB50773.1 hypothetical protein LH61_04560 [Leuconostoc mesenteroides P45]